ERTRRPYLEYSSFAGAIIFHTFMALLMNFYLLGSAHVAVLIVLASQFHVSALLLLVIYLVSAMRLSTFGDWIKWGALIGT
ncbi:hypothetical protein NPS74_24300, partial [Cutibacterium acnes subsp. acnes]|nr:hypothetical protein [Cutibacterium acnes subsp. acnes]